ncbi:uncharacterized protein [Amphiura filiformis]|uniref:uncharacterized protein n=1 Tax=Amphiura filiformis TaxID=82378 RepID=UPI003B21FD02
MSSAEKKPSKVILWSTPRSLSSALTKCLSFVPDSVIWFEPYMGAMYYGTDSRYSSMVWKDKPKSQDSKTKQPKSIHLPEDKGYDVTKSSYKWCQSQLEAEYLGKRVVFVKEISCAITTRFDAIPSGYKHSFIIRNPLKVLPSWKRAQHNTGLNGPYEEYTLKDSNIPASGYFFKESYDLYQHIKENYESNPIILDADDLLMNPGGILKAYCNAMDIPYTDDLLHWDSSGDVIRTWNIRRNFLDVDQSEALSFMGTAVSSSEFLEPTKGPSRDNLAEEELKCVDFCMPYYEKLYEKRLIC